MKKSILSLFVLTAIVAGGAALYEWSVIEKLSGDILKQTGTVAEAYVGLTKETILPLSEKFTLTLTTGQQAAVKRADTSAKELANTTQLEERIRLIATVQSTLKTFVSSATPDQELSQDPVFLHLQREVSDRSSLNPQLEAYNSLAIRWNNAIQSQMGRVSGSFEGGNRSILPFLRYDGRQEYVPIIAL